MNNRTVVQTMLLLVGAVVMLGGLVCVVAGFASLGSPGEDGDAALALFASGGFAMVIGFGIVAFTRAATATGRSGSRRSRSCPACGAALSASARFCASCGAAVR